MPAIQPRAMHVPAGLPIDESTRPEALEVGQANTSNVNVRSEERGTLCKRLGFASLPGTTRFDATTRSSGGRLFSHKDRVCTIDGTQLDVYDEDKALAAVAGRPSECRVSTRPMAASSTTDVFDIALCNGYLVTASNLQAPKDGKHRVWCHVETADGVVVRKQEQVYTATSSSDTLNATLGTYGVYVILFATDTGTGNIVGYYLDTTSAATIATGWQSIGNLATDKVTSGTGDYIFSTHSLSDRVALAYINSSAGASRVTVKTVRYSGVVETQTVNTSSVTPSSVGVEGSISDTLWVAWNETTSIKMIGLDADVLATTLATTATVITTSASANTAAPFIISESTAGAARIVVTADLVTSFRRITTSAGAVATSGSQVDLQVTHPNCRPFTYGGRYYAVFCYGYGNNPQKHAILCDFTDVGTYPWLRPVAHLFPSLIDTGLAVFHLHPAAMSATKYAIALPVITSGARASTITLVEFEFASLDRWDTAPSGDSTLISGGILGYLDGARYIEASFLHAPSTPSGATAAGSPGRTGDYRYVAVFEEQDAAGQWCISSVSSPSSVVTLAGQDATVTTYPLTMSHRISATLDPRLVVSFYRTDSTGEPPYYYAGSVENDTSAAITFTDSVSDATLITRALLYGTGNLPGVNGSGQDRRAPPYANHVVRYGDMLVIASGTDLWWSGQLVVGEGPWFNPVFQVPVPGSGEVTGLAVQDGTLYAFKRTAIYAVAGEAPSDNGSSGGLGSPRRLATDVGCVRSRSIVATGLGIFFQSERGIEMLTRAGEVVWVGEQVEDTLADWPIVTSAVLDERNNVVRFSLADSLSSGQVATNGRDLVFDLGLRAWISVDDKRGSIASQASQDAAMVYLDGDWRYAWQSNAGVVYYERDEDDASAYLDGSSWVTAQYELPPWKLGLQQEQRIYEVAVRVERHSAAGLTVECAHDGGAYAAVTSDKVWTESATSSQRVLPYRPKPRSYMVQFRVKDTSPATLGTGQGFTFVGISADIAPIQGATRGTPRVATSLRR